MRVVSPNSSFANDIGTHLTTMQDILVIILKASLLALQNKALDVSELLVEDGASSDSEVDEES